MTQQANLTAWPQAAQTPRIEGLVNQAQVAATYVYIYICIYIYVYVRVYTYIYIYVYTYCMCVYLAFKNIKQRLLSEGGVRRSLPHITPACSKGIRRIQWNSVSMHCNLCSPVGHICSPFPTRFLSSGYARAEAKRRSWRRCGKQPLPETLSCRLQAGCHFLLP